MLNNFQVFEFPEARYLFLKELDTRGPIGQLLLNIDPHLANIVMGMAETIDLIHCAQPGEYIRVENDVNTHIFVHIGEVLPGLILTHSEYNWNEFISAYCAFVHEYVQAMHHNYSILVERDEVSDDDRCFVDHKQRELEDLRHAVMPTLKLAEIGIGYNELLQASSAIVEELKSWRQSRPASLRLSRAYLEALGISN